MTSAETIRHARESAGLSQSALASRLGVTQPSVARLERAGADPRVSTLRRALNAAGYALVLRATPMEGAVDETQIVERVRLTPAERLALFERSHRNLREFVGKIRRAGAA